MTLSRGGACVGRMAAQTVVVRGDCGGRQGGGRGSRGSGQSQQCGSGGWRRLWAYRRWAVPTAWQWRWAPATGGPPMADDVGAARRRAVAVGVGRRQGTDRTGDDDVEENVAV
jgi:hypothetical protein